MEKLKIQPDPFIGSYIHLNCGWDIVLKDVWNKK